jgi:hypothetical protein
MPGPTTQVTTDKADLSDALKESIAAMRGASKKSQSGRD